MYKNYYKTNSEFVKEVFGIIPNTSFYNVRTPLKAVFYGAPKRSRTSGLPLRREKATLYLYRVA